MTCNDAAIDWGDLDADDGSERATDYLRTVTGLDAIREYKRRTHELLEPAPGDRILDAGCGIGDDVAILADRVGPEGAVVGVDRSQSLVATARSRTGSSTAFQVGDVHQLPFADRSFDACRADRVFQHLRDPPTALSELVRVTRPGGSIAVSDPNWETLVLQAPGLDEEVTAEVTSGEWTSSRNPAIGTRLYALFRDAGLEEVRVEPHAVVLTDYETANEVLSVDERLDRIREAGTVSPSRVDQWAETVQNADDDGRFLCSMTGYTVVGSVPPL